MQYLCSYNRDAASRPARSACKVVSRRLPIRKEKNWLPGSIGHSTPRGGQSPLRALRPVDLALVHVLGYHPSVEHLCLCTEDAASCRTCSIVQDLKARHRAGPVVRDSRTMSGMKTGLRRMGHMRGLSTPMPTCALSPFCCVCASGRSCNPACSSPFPPCLSP